MLMMQLRSPKGTWLALGAHMLFIICCACVLINLTCASSIAELRKLRHCSEATAKVAKMSLHPKNCKRDMLRFVKLPLEACSELI